MNSSGYDNVGVLMFVGLVLMIYLIGFGVGMKQYSHDTFDCTNSCGGAHSVYNDNTCYCKVGE
jgi:hypothetical protein